METKVQAPSHLCPECGEWWIVESVSDCKWMVVRYGDHIYTWCEKSLLPVCPDCTDVPLDPWLIETD